MATKKKPIKPQATVIIPDIEDDSEIQTFSDSKESPLELIAKQIEEAKKNGAKRIRYSDDQKSTILKWIEEHDSEHGRGGASKVATKLGISPISISQWKQADGSEPKERKPRTPKAEPITDSISEDVFVKILAGKGFNFVRLVNSITGEVVKEESDKKIEALGPYQFKAIPRNAEHDAVYVTQTSNQVQVSMSLDKFLSVSKTKP
jgi:hypothetical protein